MNKIARVNWRKISDELAADNAALRKEVEELRIEAKFNLDQYQDCGNELYKLSLERDSLADQLAAEKLDAGRYRWLRNYWWFTGAEDRLVRLALTPEELDVAVDFATQGEKT